MVHTRAIVAGTGAQLLSIMADDPRVQWAALVLFVLGGVVDLLIDRGILRPKGPLP